MQRLGDDTAALVVKLSNLEVNGQGGGFHRRNHETSVEDQNEPSS